MQISINNCELNEVQHHNYLGIKIDNKLTWENHYRYVNSKIMPLCGAMYRANNVTSENSRKIVYLSYIESVFRYLIIIYLSCTSNLFSKYQTLQNKAIKTCFGLHPRTPTQDILNISEVLSLAQLLKLEQSKYVHKLLNKKHKSNIEIQYINNT